MALIQGMNIFASAMILSQVPLEEFLEWPPEKRVQEFGLLIGTERIVRTYSIIKIPHSNLGPVGTIQRNTCSARRSNATSIIVADSNKLRHVPRNSLP